MSKKTSTRWYIGAWVIWALAWVIMFMTGHTTTTKTSFLIQGSSPLGAVALIVMLAASVVMFVMWIGALIRLGQLRSWGWFAAVLILQLIGLGIVGMGAYAVSGPEGEGMAIRRPTVT